MIEKNVTVKMVRTDLEKIPLFAVPAGYSIRWFRAGDETPWTEIQSAAEKFHQITPQTFLRVFGRNATWLSQRLCFILDPEGIAIATGAAWFDDNFDGQKFGRIHWIAVRPEHQGRGLGRILLSQVCLRLRDLRHSNAYLITSSARLPALRLYLSFGFQPLARNERDEMIWQDILCRLKG